MKTRAPRSARVLSVLWLPVVAAILWSAAARPTDAQEADAGQAQYNGAVQLQNDGLYDAASDAWKKFLKDFPEHRLAPNARFNLGVCYLNTTPKRRAEAIEAFQPAIAAFQAFLKANPNPKDKETRDAVARTNQNLERAYLNLGAGQLGLGQETGKKEHLEQAVATLSTLVKQYPKGTGSRTDLAYYNRAEAHYSLGDKDAALTDYALVVKEFPESERLGDALYSQGFILHDQKKWEAASEAYSAFLTHAKLKMHPLVAEVRMRYGQTLLEREQFSEAEEWLKRAAETKDFNKADEATLNLADSYAQRKKYEEAADLYLSIPEKFPKLKNVDHGFALLEGGKSAYQAKQHAKARTALAKVIALGGKPAAEAAHWTARSYLQEQKPAEALRTIEAALPAAKGAPFEGELMLDRGDALYEIPERRKASVAAFYKVATASADPGIAQRALYNAAFAAMKTDDLATAIKYCDEFLTKHKDSSLANSVRYVQAESLLQSKEYSKAGAAYQQLIDAAPGHADQDLWRVRVGQCAHLERKYEAAVTSLKANLPSIKRSAMRAEANYLLGSSHVELGQQTEAVKALDAALADAPSGWTLADDAHVMLATAHRKLKDYKKGAEHARRVLDMKDSNVLEDAHYQLATCSLAQDDYKAAAEAFQWLLDNGKDARFRPFALSGLGETHTKQGEWAQAVAVFTRLIEGHAEHPEGRRAYLSRGVAHQQLKQFDKAEADLRKFLELETDAPEKSDVRFEIGKCQSAQKKHADAEKTFASILADDPKYAKAADVLFELGWALADQGKSVEALKQFEELSTKHGDSPLGIDALLQVGEIRFREGEAQQKLAEQNPMKAEYKTNATKAFGEAATAYSSVDQQAQKLQTAGKIAAPRAAGFREQALHKLGWCQFHGGDFTNAHKAFESQLSQWPEGSYAADGAFMVGESLLQQKKYAEAGAQLESYVKNYGKERFVPRAIWHAAESANQMGLAETAKAADAAGRKRALSHHQHALDLVADFATKHPEFEFLPEVSYEEARAHHFLGSPDKAEPMYEAITRKTGREVAAKARFMIGELHFEKAVRMPAGADKQKALQKALEHFYNVAYGYGYKAWQANGLYEAARCLEQLPNLRVAKERYQELIKKFPESDKAPLAKKRLEQLAG